MASEIPSPSAESHPASTAKCMASIRIAKRLRALANDKRREADELELLAAEAEEQPTDPDPWLTLREINDRFGFGRDRLMAARERGELELLPRQGDGAWQARQSEVERWRGTAGKPRSGPPRPEVMPEVDETAEYDRQLAALPRRSA
jgi:hypothetical protein